MNFFGNMPKSYSNHSWLINRIKKSIKETYTQVEWKLRDVNEKEIINKYDLFFVLSLGRSGTKTLAQLLNESHCAHVCHEPHAEFDAYQKAFNSERDAKQYIERFRKKDILLRAHKEDPSVYGEVNSIIRRHCNALKWAFPNAKLLHLVRDGRDVVRSAISRETMTNDDENTESIRPPERRGYSASWDEIDRFRKLCWYWKIENEYLRKNIKDVVRFEDLVDSFEKFERNFLNKLPITVGKKTYDKIVQKKFNKTSRYRIPHWRNWSNHRYRMFMEICGDEMARYGYV